jgi:hypothetical protein
VERLPAHGHYKSALAMDEVWAARILELEEKGQAVAAAADPTQLTPLGYSPEVSYLSLIADRLVGVRDAVIAGAGNDPPPGQPLPRPVTALDRLREAASRTELLSIDQFIRGGRPALNGGAAPLD